MAQWLKWLLQAGKAAGSTVLNIEKGVKGGMTGLAEFLRDEWDDYDSQLVNLTREAGMSIRQYENIKKEFAGLGNRIMDNGQTFIQNYGISAGKAMSYMNDYQKAIGRNITLSDEQLGKYAALKEVLGDAGATIANGFTDFGIGVEKTEELMSASLEHANSVGIRMDKITQNITQHMDEIQMYTFDNGVQGFIKMAEKASEVNFNMSQALSFANKMQNVGDAIKVGSQLQVLGGSFSQMSNPLEMFYEATSDVGALQERMVNMFKNLGKFDKKTGQVEISRFNRMRIQNAAQSMGISAQDMMKMINTSASKDEINRQIGSNVTGDLREYLKNTATLNAEGQAVVTIDGKQRNVSDLTDEDVKHLREVNEMNTGQSINQIAIDVHTMKEKMDMWRMSEAGVAQGLMTGSPGEFIAGFGEEIQTALEGLGDGLGGKLLKGITGGIGGLIGNASDWAGENVDKLGEKLAAGIGKIQENIQEEIAKGGLSEEQGAELSALMNGLAKAGQSAGRGGSTDMLIGEIYRAISTEPITTFGEFGRIIDSIKNGYKGKEKEKTGKKDSNGNYNGGIIPIASTPHAAGGTISLDGVSEGGLLTGGAPGVELPVTRTTFADGGYTENTAQSGEYVVNAPATSLNLDAISTINSHPDVAFDVMPRASWPHEDGGELVTKATELGETIASDVKSNNNTIVAPNISSQGVNVNGGFSIGVNPIEIKIGNDTLTSDSETKLRKAVLETLADILMMSGGRDKTSPINKVLEAVKSKI